MQHAISSPRRGVCGICRVWSWSRKQRRESHHDAVVFRV